jgi:hypothetical protein
MRARVRALLAAVDEVDHARILVAVAAIAQVLLTLRLFEYGSEPAGDDMSIHMAEVAAIARSIGSGEFDLWNPSANGGFASAYYYQFLPQLGCALLYLALGWLISLTTLFKLTCVATLVALPIAVYRGLRVIGLRPIAAAAGGFAASFAYAASGWGANVDSLFSTGLYTQSFALVAFPLAAAYSARYLWAGEHLGRAVVYTLVCGLSHPFIAFAIAPAMLCAPWWRVQPRRLARRAAILFGLVLAVSAPLWLPIIAHYDTFGGFPERVAGEDGISGDVFGPGFLRGRFLDEGRLPVLSVLSLGAIALALVGRRRFRLLAPVAGAGVLYAGLIVLGPLLPKTRGDLIPMIRFLAPMQICLAAAGGAALAIAAAEVIDRARGVRPRWVVGLGVGALCASLAIAVVHGGVLRSKERVKTIDHFEELDRDQLAEVIDHISDRGSGRVFADGRLGTGSHWWMYQPYVHAGHPAVRAYGGASLQSSPTFVYLRSHFDLARHWRHFAVRYALVHRDAEFDPKTLAAARRVFVTRDYAVWAFPVRNLWAPVRVREQVSGDRATIASAGIAWMTSVEAGSDDVIAFGDAPPGDLADPERAAVGQTVVDRAYHRAEVRIGGERPALLRLAVSIHPGWRATVDGEPAAIYRVSPAFMAVVVPPGRHVVRFEFRRPWWSWALWLALLAGGAIAVMLRRRRRIAAAVAAVAALAFAPAAEARPSHAPVGAAFGDGAAAVSTASGLWIRSGPDRPFEYLCPRAAGTDAGAFEPRLAVAGPEIYAATYRDIRAGRGCELEPVALVGPSGRAAAGRWIESVAVGADGTVWLASADGTSANDVYRGAAEGFASAGLRSTRRWYLSALPAPSDPRVVYASGYQVAPLDAALFVSSDGRRFEPVAGAGIGFGPSRRSRFAAVDPGDPDTAYLIAEGAGARGDVLYRTRDRGARFDEVLAPGAPIAGVVAFAGGEVWVAAPGLHRLGPRPTDFDGPALSCLARDRDRLIACRADALSTGVALVDIDRATGAQTPALATSAIRPPCAARAERCAADWARACKVLGADCAPAPRPTPKHHGAGEPAPAPEPRPLPLFIALLIVAAAVPWLLRRRR